MKYDVTYSCQHTGTVEIEGNEAQINSKLYWYRNRAVCPVCYKAQKDEERAHEPKVLHVLPSAEIDSVTGEQKTLLWLTGNTREVKDNLKEVGFYWGMLNDIQVLNTTSSSKVWYIEGPLSVMRDLARNLLNSHCADSVVNHGNTALGRQNAQAAQQKKASVANQNLGILDDAPFAVDANGDAGSPFMSGVLPNGEVAAMVPCAPMEQPYCVRGKAWDGYVYCTKQTAYIDVDGRQYNLTDADIQDFKNYAVALQNCGLLLLRQLTERNK